MYDSSGYCDCSIAIVNKSRAGSYQTNSDNLYNRRVLSRQSSTMRF